MNFTVSDWNGYKKIDFLVNGRKSFIVCPKNPLPGNPWIWRTEFFGAFDYADRALLEKGWHLAYHCVSDMYGCPESIDMMYEFYKVVVCKYNMGSRPALFGFSRGGLYAVNFALLHPEFVGAIYLDAPVLDIRSWPGGKGRGVGEPSCWEECKNWYKLTEDTAPNFRNNPLDNAEKIAAAKIPILLVCGEKDRFLPYDENGLPFYERIKISGGIIEQIVKPDCDHHPHSLLEPSPIVTFIEKAILSKNTYIFPKIKMNVIGDSITRGTYTAQNDTAPNSFAEKPWCLLVKEKLGFANVNNYGSNGTSISSTSPILPEKAFSLRYNEMSDDANLIIVAGGTNDFGTCVPLGSKEDITDISFYGGLRVLCESLKNKFPKATIVFITPIKRTDKSINDNGNNIEQYSQAIKQIAKDIYNFHIIDGSKISSEINLEPHLSDKVHPTPEGHKLLSDAISVKLISILNNAL